MHPMKNNRQWGRRTAHQAADDLVKLEEMLEGTPQQINRGESWEALKKKFPDYDEGGLASILSRARKRIRSSTKER